MKVVQLHEQTLCEPLRQHIRAPESEKTKMSKKSPKCKNVKLELAEQNKFKEEKEGEEQGEGG